MTLRERGNPQNPDNGSRRAFLERIAWGVIMSATGVALGDDVYKDIKNVYERLAAWREGSPMGKFIVLKGGDASPDYNNLDRLYEIVRTPRPWRASFAARQGLLVWPSGEKRADASEIWKEYKVADMIPIFRSPKVHDFPARLLESSQIQAKSTALVFGQWYYMRFAENPEHNIVYPANVNRARGLARGSEWHVLVNSKGRYVNPENSVTLYPFYIPAPFVTQPGNR